LFFYSQILKKYLNKVVLFLIKMATGFILAIAITVALGMLLVPAIGTVTFAENMTGKDSNMTGMASNMTGMTGNMTSNMTGMTGNMTG
jgi:hypothetical protein